MFAHDLKHLAKYFDIYDILLNQSPISAEDIKKELMFRGIPETTARRMISEFNDPVREWLVIKENNEYEIEEYGMESLLNSLSEWLGISTVLRRKYVEDTNELKNEIDEINELYELVKEADADKAGTIKAISQSRDEYLQKWIEMRDQMLFYKEREAQARVQVDVVKQECQMQIESVRSEYEEKISELEELFYYPRYLIRCLFHAIFARFGE